jgi:5-methylcytosine-specific restriction endonuclease McrA
MSRKPATPPQRVEQVWQKGAPIRGKDPDLYRRDAFGNEIYKPSFGKGGEKSWEIDHIRPIAKDGSENLRNLQPLQTAANRAKGDTYPFNPKSLPPRDE